MWNNNHIRTTSQSTLTVISVIWAVKRLRELTRVRFTVLCCLMTPGLSKDIRCHVWLHPLLCLQITRLYIRILRKRAVSLVTADGHLIFLRGCVDMLTCSLYHPWGLSEYLVLTVNQTHVHTRTHTEKKIWETRLLNQGTKHRLWGC